MCAFQQKNHKSYKEAGKYGPFKGKKINKQKLSLKKTAWWGGASRWWKSKTWRSPSSPQIHQKYIYMCNNSYRTPTERWQKTSDLSKGKKLPTYLGRAKEKTETKE